MVIGRTTAADIILDDDLLSATHMALEVVEGEVWVEDLGSRNGTVIDGNPVTGRIRVRPGSTLAAGRTTVTLR
jgi:pSer/pThr/pTyr-binding forkhead associated (FHA) protein